MQTAGTHARPAGEYRRDSNSAPTRGFEVRLGTLCPRRSSGPRDFRNNCSSAHPASAPPPAQLAPPPRPCPWLDVGLPPPSNRGKVCRLFCRGDFTFNWFSQAHSSFREGVGGRVVFSRRVDRSAGLRPCTRVGERREKGGLKHRPSFRRNLSGGAAASGRQPRPGLAGRTRPAEGSRGKSVSSDRLLSGSARGAGCVARTAFYKAPVIPLAAKRQVHVCDQFT